MPAIGVPTAPGPEQWAGPGPAPGPGPADPAPAGSPGRHRPARRTWWPRWLRLVLPLAVVAVLLLVTLVSHLLQQPFVTNPNYLSPNSGTAFGGRTLADTLRTRGLLVERVTGSGQAFAAAAAGGVTLFIPAPDLVNPEAWSRLAALPATTQVVLVAPDAPTAWTAGLPVAGARHRWATTATDPGCDFPAAANAGRAGVLGVRYRPAPSGQVISCYDGALLVVPQGAVPEPEAAARPGGVAPVVLVGATEPFRNDRIGEYHNADLAVGLLDTRPEVVWLDLHRPELPPAATAPPPAAAGGGNPLAHAFPGWLWWTLALLALIAVVLALASARRLGPPVAEPLPVAVPVAETVEGRGRLYRRTRDAGFAIEVLRRSARARLAAVLRLAPGTDPDTLAAWVAQRTGWPPGAVTGILYGADPRDDAELVDMASDLDALVREARDVRGGGPATADRGDAR